MPTAPPGERPEGGAGGRAPGPRGGNRLFPEEAVTVQHRRGQAENLPRPLPPRSQQDPPTEIFKGGQRKSAADSAPSPGLAREVMPPSAKGAVADPVVGWLVIIDGPGRGAFVAVGHGQSRIGRGPSNRINLDYGDANISRDGNATIVFDPRRGTFYLAGGQGVNLCYVDEQPVINAMELKDRTDVVIGNTRLRFVAFCGPQFSWADDAE
jgi:hypothetical protein